jgi:hypothetical protein
LGRGSWIRLQWSFDQDTTFVGGGSSALELRSVTDTAITIEGRSGAISVYDSNARETKYYASVQGGDLFEYSYIGYYLDALYPVGQSWIRIPLSGGTSSRTFDSLEVSFSESYEYIGRDTIIVDGLPWTVTKILFRKRSTRRFTDRPDQIAYLTVMQYWSDKLMLPIRSEYRSQYSTDGTLQTPSFMLDELADFNLR